MRRRELSPLHPGTFVDHAGTPTWLQRAWAGVLYASPAVLCDESALRVVKSQPGLLVHRTAHLDERALWQLGPPRVRYEEAILDLAARARSDLDAVGVVTEACGSRCTTAMRLLESLARRVRLPRRRFVQAVLTDVHSGACSVLEHAYLQRVERAHGLPRALR